jgi:hypothetical protein
MIWQTPVLSFTAEAFLFLIALSSGATETSRLISAVLALAVAVASIQLLLKHEHMELIDSVLLETIEDKLKLAETVGVANPFHTAAKLRRAGLVRGDGKPVEAPWPTDLQSPFWWTMALCLFAAAAVAVIAITLVHPGWLP